MFEVSELLMRDSEILLNYTFAGSKPVLQPSAPIEKAILESIERNHPGLQFYSVRALYRGDCFTQGEPRVFRLKSPAHHAHIDFAIEGRYCNALLLVVSPEAQGHFYRVKDFLIKQFAAIVFDATSVEIIEGYAQANDLPIRRKPNKKGDWRRELTADGTPRLVALYQRLGFVQKAPNSNRVAMTRETFELCFPGLI